VGAVGSMEVRCPTCECLLARRLEDGSLEVRRRQQVLAIIRRGAVACTGCGTRVVVPPPVDVFEVGGLAGGRQ
jgi:DNA-directed RNA polymerase subunit RPC12/RpoP